MFLPQSGPDLYSNRESHVFDSPQIQVANTWPKITTRDIYKMVRKGEEQEDPSFSSVAATFEKANTYDFAGSLIRNAEVVGSNPICSTSNPLMIKNLDDQRFQRRFSVSPIYAKFF